MILVAGGSGFIGSAVVRHLVARGREVCAMTAHPERTRARIERLGARMVVGDLRDPASLERAVAGAESVVQVTAFPNYPMERPRQGYTFEEFEARGTRRLVEAAARAGARKFVYASGVGAAPDAPRHWFRAKWEGEEAVRASGLPHAIVRPSWVYGPGDRSLNRFVAFHRWLPFVPVIGDGLQRLNPVFVEDAGEVFARAAEPDGPEGTFELGGPEVLTMNQILETMMEVRGRRKPLVHFPPLLPKLAGLALGLLPNPPFSAQAIDFAMADAVADTTALLERFDVRLTPLREALATYLAPPPRA
jgi:uncharacterized protein YbjT (DUF2867 family)